MSNNSQYVLCINNKLEPELLTKRKIYRVFASEPGEDGYIWIVDDRGDDGFFDPHVFVFVTFSVDVDRYFPLPDGGDDETIQNS